MYRSQTNIVSINPRELVLTSGSLIGSFIGSYGGLVVVSVIIVEFVVALSDTNCDVLTAVVVDMFKTANVSLISMV